MSAERFHRSMNGYRVIQDGKPGALVRCESAYTKGTYYWRVKFDSGGPWASPDRVIAESEGPCVARCVECDLKYYGNSPSAGGLCPNCVQALDRQLGVGGDHTPAHKFGRRRR
jgi:hypothetical protein